METLEFQLLVDDLRNLSDRLALLANDIETGGPDERKAEKLRTLALQIAETSRDGADLLDQLATL